MALQGNYKKITTSFSETETETVEIIHPADLPESHPNYDKRGTTEVIENPVLITTEEILENVYLIVTGTTIEKSIDGWNLSYAYRLFPSTDDNDSIDPGSDDYVHLHTDSFALDETTLDANPVESTYNYLKTLPECVNMVNA